MNSTVATTARIQAGEGRLYVCAFKDVFSNRVVGYSIDTNMKSRLAVAALNNAVAHRHIEGNNVAGCVVHTDSKNVKAKVFPSFVTHTPIDPRGYCGVGGVLAAS